MKRLIQITLFGLLSLFTGAFSQVSSSKWQSQPIVIDGDGSDWGTLPRFFNAESNVKYEFRNDSQNLYIILKAADRATQMQLVMAGFNIKLKIKTSPPSKLSIAFPALKKGEMPSLTNMDGRTNKLAEKSETQPEFTPKDTVILDGFQFSHGKIVSENKDEKSICFASNKGNRDQTSYEIRIPLREIFGNDFQLENISTLPIQLQVVINELSQKESKNRRGKMSGGMHGGGRGMGGGMPGGGGEMGGGEMGGGGMPGGGEVGEAPGADEQNETQGHNELSMERKSFSIDFKLSTGK